MPRKNVPPQANFGRALQTLRAARGATQEDMLLATSRRHMSRIEQGHQMPSIRIIENLAAGLQIHPLTLIVEAYCPGIDAISVKELLTAVTADFEELNAG